MTNFLKPVSLKGSFFLPVIFVFALLARANENTSEKHKWHCLVEPCLIFPTLKETTPILTLPDAELEVDPTDIFSSSKIGIILYFEMAKDKLAFSSDLVDMNFDDRATSKPVIEKGNVNHKIFSWELAGLPNLLSCLDVVVVSRFHNIKTNVDLQVKIPEGRINSNTICNSMEQTWFDPIRTI